MYKFKCLKYKCRQWSTKPTVIFAWFWKNLHEQTTYVDIVASSSDFQISYENYIYKHIKKVLYTFKWLVIILKNLQIVRPFVLRDCPYKSKIPCVICNLHMTYARLNYELVIVSRESGWILTFLLESIFSAWKTWPPHLGQVSWSPSLPGMVDTSENRWFLSTLSLPGLYAIQRPLKSDVMATFYFY